MSDSDEFASMIELDLPPVAPVAPAKATAAPAVTATPPVVSPLVAGRTLLFAATTPTTLAVAADEVARVCNAAGLTDRAHATRVQLRALYRVVLTSFAWLRLWASLARAVEERPALVRGAPITPPLAATGNPLADTLGEIAVEGTHNATAHGAGSMAGGQLRGVGFSSAEGYVTALRNGVKPATAESYKQTLRTSYGYTPAQIAALPVTLLTDAPLPVGAGITHTPVSGQSVADMTPAQVKAAWAKPIVNGESETMREVRNAMRSGEIMTVAGAVASGKAYMWNGLGETTRGALRTVLATAGLPESLLPAQASAVATAGLVLRDENHRGLVAKPERAVKGHGTVKRKAKVVVGADGMPRQYLTRWTVQELTHGDVGEHAGTIIATATVWSDGSLTVDGDETIKMRVEGEYNRRRDAEVYEAGQVTAWLQKLITTNFDALPYFGWYVPAKHTAAMDRLYTAIDSVWGSWRVPMPMVTCDALRAGLTKGLADEVNAVLADVDKAHAAGLTMTPKRSQITPAQAAAFLAQLQELAARATKHVETLGGEYATKVRSGIAVAMERLRGLATDGDIRASLLELDGLK